MPPLWKEIQGHDKFGNSSELVIAPGTKVPDAVGVLIPSLDGLHRWRHMYEKSLEKLYPLFKIGHDFDHDANKLHF